MLDVADLRFLIVLCIMQLNMFNYLSSDNKIRQPFLLDEILPRFTSMMLNVLSKIVGQRGLEIKVCST